MQFSTVFAIIVASQLFISATKGQQMEPDLAKFPMLLKQLVSIARYTNLWTTDLCEGLPEYQRQGCVQCFFTVASPENNQNFLANFTRCAQEFLPENFKLCYNIAQGTNISIPIGEIEVNLNPQNDISRGRMVIKCLKVTSKGLKGSMCLNQLKSGNPKMFSGEMSAMDFILLNNCYQKEKTDGMFDEGMLMPVMGTARGKFRLSQLNTVDEEDFTVNYKTAMLNLLTTFLSNEDDNQLGMAFEPFNHQNKPKPRPQTFNKFGILPVQPNSNKDNPPATQDQDEDTEFLGLDTNKVETTLPKDFSNLSQDLAVQPPQEPGDFDSNQNSSLEEADQASEVVTRSKRCV